MCGILGVAGAPADGADDDTLAAALDLIRHRGPDAGGLWRGAGIALGHRRLSIIDLDPRAGQPMRRGPLALTFNGEIYNYRQVRDELVGRGHRFATTSDTEVLLAAWQEWGRACLDRLEGMFAFGLWDGAERVLHLVRDRYGEKPLFWLGGDGGLRFASEVPPLVRLTHGNLEEDAEAVGLYFLFSYIPAPHGPFRNLRQLEPGAWLAWHATDGRIEAGHYYRVRAAVAPLQPPPTYDEAVAALRTRLSRAVRLRLETADVPVATLLSGGLDSSVVTTLAARYSERPLTAYSLGFPDDPGFDESRYARDVAAGLPAVRHRIVPATEDRILDFADRVFDRLGEPFADASLLPTAYLSAHIEEKVALGGDAADELMAGYGTYPAIVRGAALPGFVRTALTLLPRHGNPHAIRIPALRAAALFHKHLHHNPVDTYLSWRAYADARTLADLGIETDAGASLRAALGGAITGSLRDVQLVDLAFNLPNDMLKKVDYAAMYHGIEVRLPYLDSDLVHWTLGLPDAFRMGAGVRKRILRDAFADDLPASILTRRKMGFLLPIRRWFKGGRMRDELDALGAGQTGLERTVLAGVVKRHADGTEDNAVLLWAVYAYLRWRTSISRWAGHAAPSDPIVQPAEVTP